MKIVVTGANGFLGRHVRICLGALDIYRHGVVPIDREAFNDASLETILSEADIVIHCAGINRDKDRIVEDGNRDIAERLVEALCDSIAKPHLFYANTTQREYDNAYGRGKRAAHRVLAEWAERRGAKYTELVLPHVFGEGGQPYYNSAVQTFCHQVVNGEEMSINGAGDLELLHAQDVAATIVGAFERGRVGELRLTGRRLSVAEAAGKIVSMYRCYSDDVVPDLRDRFDLQLFNTLRHAMYPAFYPRRLALHSDQRGSLFEAVKNRNGGQTFLSTTRPGIARGNHYHFNKVERFLVIKGRAVIRIRPLLEEHVEEFHVTGDTPAFVDMPTLHTHSITNTGDEDLLTLFWSHEVFDPANPDTYAEPVLRDKE